MVVAGLTGGIATGKSTVAGALASFGAELIDADRIARDVVRKDMPAWRLIREHFGPKALLEDGRIDREYLGSIIFGDDEKKSLLNSIVHPAVFEEINRRLLALKSHAGGAVVVCDVPLLIETGMHCDFEEVILVYVPFDVQVERLMSRDKISRDVALKKVNSQMPIEEKRQYATMIIDNSGSREQTYEQALSAYRHLKEKAKEARP